MMADTILVAQYHIQEKGLAGDELTTQISNIGTECVRVGHMFNRVISLLWDCFMVCGLKLFIVSHSTFHYTISFAIEFQSYFNFLCSNLIGLMAHTSTTCYENFNSRRGSTKMAFVKFPSIEFTRNGWETTESFRLVCQFRSQRK